MSRRYPIVRHRELRPFFRWSALCQRLRPLTAGPAQILVYETDWVYVAGVDPGRAVAVSLVDLHRDRPIILRRVRREYQVRLTGYFRCTVTDPVEVVRARHRATYREIRRLLTESLLAVPGFDYRPDREEELRERLIVRFRDTMTPTPIPGVRVFLDRIAIFGPRPRAEYDPDYNEA
jgi:hypothetical protein